MAVTPEDLGIPRASLGETADIEEAVNPALERVAAIMTPQDQGPLLTVPDPTPARRGMIYHATSPVDLILRCDGVRWHPIVEFPIGGVLDWPATTSPESFWTAASGNRVTWLELVGGSVNSANYPLLAAAWGITGATIALPDRRGRVGVGAGTGTGLSARTVGAVGGAERHALTAAQMPRHQHVTVGLVVSSVGVTAGNPVAEPFGQGVTGFAGGNSSGATEPHENMQPFRVTRYFVRAA